MSDHDISIGEGFTNGLAQADIERIKRAIVSAIDAYRARASRPAADRPVGGPMTHDELCPLARPCDFEFPDHGYCGLSAPTFCIHCEAWCICEELDKKREQAILDCIAAVEGQQLYDEHGNLTGVELKEQVIGSLRALQDKP